MLKMFSLKACAATKKKRRKKSLFYASSVFYEHMCSSWLFIHLACKKKKKTKKEKKQHTNVVKWKLMECKVECKCINKRRKLNPGWRSGTVACADRDGTVFCIPSLPRCLRRNRRPRSGRAGWGWYNSHWITEALISPLGFCTSMG